MRDADLTPDGLRVIELHADRLVAREIDSGFEFGIARGLNGSEWKLTLSLDGRRVSLMSHGELRIWDMAAGSLIRSWPCPQPGSVWMMPCGRRILECKHPLTKTMHLYDVDSGLLLRTLSGSTRIEDVVISPDGRRVTASTDDWGNEEPITTWDTGTGEIFEGYATAGFYVQGGGQSTASADLPDGFGKIGGFDNGRVAMLDAAGQIRWLYRHLNFVRMVCVVGGGRAIVSDSYDGTVMVCLLENGAVIGEPFRIQNSLRRAALREDGTTLVLLESDGGPVHVRAGLLRAPGVAGTAADAGEFWGDVDKASPYAHRRVFETAVASGEIVGRIRALAEPLTSGGVDAATGGLLLVLRLRDGTAVRLQRDGGEGPITGTVILPRVHAFLDYNTRREFNDSWDAERRLNAIEGLLNEPQPQPWFAELPSTDASADELWLGGNRLRGLPASIGGLRQLRSLSVETNCLESLPSEIGRLANLEYLDLSANLLTELPLELFDLVNLRELRLSKNRLKKLPKAIGRLTRLKRLYLDRNLLESLPEEIGGLPELTHLWVHYNRLRALPAALGRLNLQPSRLDRGPSGRALPSPTSPGLRVEGNPLEDPPPAEIKGVEQIMSYLRAKLARG